MEPLASRIRPASLDDYVGQVHLVGEGKPFRVAIEQGHIFSFVLWGPPGTGKTTLARIYANAINAAFYELSAVSAGKEDIRRILKERVILDQPAAEAKRRFEGEGRDRWMFDRDEEPGEDGRILNRSFSGTYER